MTKATLEVGNLFSVLSAHGIERQLQRVAGVGRVSVNPVSGSTTVMFDPGMTSLSAIRAEIEDCGFHCAGEALPRHVCDMPAMPGSDQKVQTSRSGPAHSHVHKEHAGMPGMEPSDAKAGHTAHGGEKSDAMAHEMGHGAGMDMQVMVRDMRNRFWIALAFSLPIFLFSPMGMDFIQIPPPFGLRLDLVLFVLASAAILYPVWPFIVAAYRALRSGVANMAVLVVLSVGTGYLFSVGSTFFYGGQQFYEASAILLVFILLGHWLEMRARAGAS
jgi:P-type Cu2+ transporter